MSQFTVLEYQLHLGFPAGKNPTEVGTLTPLAEVTIRAWSFPLPPYAVFGILQDDRPLGELFPNLIGARKVAAMTRFLPLVNQLLNFFIEHLSLRTADDVQNAVDAFDGGDNFASVVFTQDASGKSCVHFASQFMYCGERHGRV